jgi:hypothetical protein
MPCIDYLEIKRQAGIQQLKHLTSVPPICPNINTILHRPAFIWHTHYAGGDPSTTLPSP